VRRALRVYPIVALRPELRTGIGQQGSLPETHIKSLLTAREAHTVLCLTVGVMKTSHRVSGQSSYLVLLGLLNDFEQITRYTEMMPVPAVNGR
jgi:hypothetical protein